MNIGSKIFWQSSKGQAVILLLILLLFGVAAFWDNIFTENRIKRHQKLGIATVYKVELDSRYHYQEVSYMVKDETTGNIDSGRHSFDELPYRIFLKLNNKTFPIIYDSTNFYFNCLLLNRSDFYKYGLSYPDSLLWLEQ